MSPQFSHRNSWLATPFWLAGACHAATRLRRCGIAWTAAFWLVASSSVLAQNGYAPQTNLTPIGGSYVGGASAGQSGSLFDPYAVPGSSYGTGTGIGAPVPNYAPSYTPNYAPPGVNPSATGNSAYPNGSLLGGLFTGSMFTGGATPAGYPSSIAPYNSPPIYNYGQPAPSASGLAPSPLGGYPASDPYPSSIYPSGSPTTLFPGGISGGSGSLFPAPTYGSSGAGGTWNQGTLLDSWSAYQFLHGPRLRQTFVAGGNGADDLGINQTDVSIGFAFNNFLYSNRPLYVVPSFSLYLFDGPITSVETNGADLPGNAYGAFLDFGWQTDPNQMIGGEIGVRLGAYSDFESVDGDIFRILGKGLLSFRLTPASTLKGGIYYLGQHDQGVLPAGGLLWQPNPYTRFDIFFPEPKISQYCRTIGTQDVWGYIAGQYIAESWRLGRASGIDEWVDLNQIEVTAGLEWGRSDLIRTGQRTAFFEGGVAFERELDYEVSNNDFSPSTTYLFRAGFGY